MYKAVDGITVKVFYLAKSCFFKKNYNLQKPGQWHFRPVVQ